MQSLKLASIPEDRYSDYRYDVIFKAYKWDPQVEDHNTISRHVVMLSREIARQLEMWAERLSEETVSMEKALAGNPAPAKELGLPGKIVRALPLLSRYDGGRNVRLMRFDFHPTETGWALSEVNSDVPGGLAEASVLPELAGKYFGGYAPGKNLARSLMEAFKARVKESGRIALVHATAYADDRQVMQFLGDCLEGNGFQTTFAAPDHIGWVDKRAVSILEGQEGELNGIVRFFPLEWLPNLPWRSQWEGFYDCETTSCNHPIAIFAQSKRLPLIWNRLGVDVPTWKSLLPETVDPGAIDQEADGWIYKPAMGRVGEGISIREAASPQELSRIRKAVRRHPGQWIAQRRFQSRPLRTEEGELYHLCIGVFTVNGKSAGFYGRISPYPRIDARAKDIPLLIPREEKRDERQPGNL